jgi:hypothetical protein
MGSEPSASNRAIRGGVPLGLFMRRPTTRMGVVWEVRRAFSAAQKYRDQRTQAVGTPPDAGLEVLVEAFAGKLFPVEMPVSLLLKPAADCLKHRRSPMR